MHPAILGCLFSRQRLAQNVGYRAHPAVNTPPSVFRLVVGSTLRQIRAQENHPAHARWSILYYFMPKPLLIHIYFFSDLVHFPSTAMSLYEYAHGIRSFVSPLFDMDAFYGCSWKKDEPLWLAPNVRRQEWARQKRATKVYHIMRYQPQQGHKVWAIKPKKNTQRQNPDNKELVGCLLYTSPSPRD